MLRYNLKFAVRNLMGFRQYSIINILGLSVGMTCVILIYLWVQNELSYDRFHQNADSIYRIVQSQYYTEGEAFNVDVTQLGMAPFVKENISGVLRSTRYTGYAPEFLIQYNDKKFIEKVNMVDSSFLNIFSFPLIKGDKNTALGNPYSIILTEETAEKFFGNADPIGKTLKINNQYLFTVTGIISKPPRNSHIAFNMLIPATFYKELGQNLDDFGNNFLYTYVQLTDGANIEDVGTKLTSLLCKNDENNKKQCTRYYLQPLSRIHLYPIWGGGPVKTMKVFSLIALLILLIACVNFINLSTALASNRLKEIGIRKANGAKTGQIMLMLSRDFTKWGLISFIIACPIAWFVMNKWLQNFAYKTNLDWWIFALAGLIAFVIALLTICWQSWRAASRNPVEALRYE